jgi:TonB family protein
MKRFFVLIAICFFASVGAGVGRAQSGRAKRAEPPKDERAGKPETKDEAKGEAKDEAGDKSRDGARATDDDKPLTGKEVAVRARLKSKPNPGYPPEARSYGVRGVVKLRIIFGADRRVGDKIEVLEGLPHGVTEEAMRAARRIEFEPARDKDGRPVSQYVIVIYHFNLY